MLFSPEADLFLEQAGARLRPMKRTEFDRLASLGFFEDEKVELLFGMVVPTAPIDPAHCESTERIHRMLQAQLGERTSVRCNAQFAASDESEPQPDVYVTPNGDYWKEYPSRAFLVVEVARSSLRRDRAKRAIYALANVDEYWIVDHGNACVEVYRDRRDGKWQSMRAFQRGEVLSPLAFPDVEIPVDEILPPT